MKPELLAPAGDWISLRAAVKAQADAVYFGIKELNMRANAKNFELSEMKKVVQFCHENNVKAYLTLNTIIYQSELDNIKKILDFAKKAKIDAVIAWDFSILKLCKELGLRIHLSTQASVSNFDSAKYYYDTFGVKRIVLARECTLQEIKKIICMIEDSKIDLEIETFIHGAMCVSVSGRCFLSQFVFNKSANRGDCLQPCRRSYIVKDTEEEHEFKLENNFVMSPKDLCAMPFIDKLIDSGIHSFKIEGRNRSPEYVKIVVSCYRDIIDYYSSMSQEMCEDSFLDDLENKKKELVENLKTVYNRGFSSGFFLGRPISEWTDVYGSKATTRKESSHIS
jgi:putative protease